MSTNSAEYARQYYQNNKDKILKRQRERHLADPEKKKAAQKRYTKKYREANPDSWRLSNQKWRLTLKGCLNRKLHHLKKAKRARTLEVDLDVDFLLSLWEKQGGKCAISDYPMRYFETSLFGVSIDRKDPKGHYTRENVQLLCQGINFAKNMYSNQEMIDFWNYRFGEKHEQAEKQAEKQAEQPGQSAAI